MVSTPRLIACQQIAETLGNFDKRLLDFQINHLREPPPPPHLHHLGIEQTGETYGRERRYKYYTHGHYLQVAERESLDKKFPEGYFDLVGEFASTDASQFYKDADEFSRFVDSYNDLAGTEASTKAKKLTTLKKQKEASQDDDRPKRGKKRKLDETTGGESASTHIPGQPKKRGRPSKHPSSKAKAGEGDDAQGSISAPVVVKKRGRPPKHPPTNESATAPAAPKKRGRPRKHPLPDAMDVDVDDHTVDSPFVGGVEPAIELDSAVRAADTVLATESVSAPVKKRGRPRKHPLPEPTSAREMAVSASKNVQPPVEPGPSAPKRRGRPPKAQARDEEIETVPKVPKRRGRLPKNQREQDVALSRPDKSSGSSGDVGEEQLADAAGDVEPGRDIPPTQSQAPEPAARQRNDASSSAIVPTESSASPLGPTSLSVEDQPPPTSVVVLDDHIAIDPALLEGEVSMATALSSVYSSS